MARGFNADSVSRVALHDPTTGDPLTTLALDGSDITLPTAMPAGGVGIRGWLSAIWTKLNGTLATTVSGTVATSAAAPVAADVLGAVATVTATGGPTTLITIPAGRTWVGTVAVNVSAANAAANATAGRALGYISTAGTNVTPAAGALIAVDARCGANAATGTVGSQSSNSDRQNVVVIAPAGNDVTLTIQTVVTGTAGVAQFSAWGRLV